MSEEYTRFEADGRFGLMESPWFIDYDDGDLGCGAYQKTTYFQSYEGREYYLHARMWEKQAKTAQRDLRWLKTALAQVLTPKGHVRRKQLLELIEGAKQ